MIVGKIRQCNMCGQENYVRIEETKCPQCGELFTSYKINKAPAGWVKLEDYEISRRSVDKMLQSGDITLEDLK